MKKIVLMITALAGSLIGASARADHAGQCARADYAKQYTAMLADKLDDHINRIGQLVTRHQKKMRVMQSALIQAGVWSEDDARVFMKNIMEADEGKALEAERKRAGEGLVSQASPSSSGAEARNAPRQLQDHDMCVDGPQMLDATEAGYHAMEKVFGYMELKVAAVAEEKNVTLPALL